MTKKRMQTRIVGYFQSCMGEPVLDENGVPVLYKGEPVYRGRVPPTMTGLALALGFKSRLELLEKQKEDILLCTAVSRVEEFAEKQLFEGSVQGARFSLANNFCGWGEKPLHAAETVPENNLFEVLAEGNDALEEIKSQAIDGV